MATQSWTDKYFPKQQKGKKQRAAVKRGRAKKTPIVLRPVSPGAKAGLSTNITRDVRAALAEKDDGDGGGILGAIGAGLSGGLGLGINLLKDVGVAIPGLSRMVYENVKDPVAAGIALSPSPVTEALGIRPSGKDAARRYSDRTIGQVRGIKDDTAYYIGPLLEGKFKEAGQRAYEHPLGAIGTYSLIYSGVGAGIGSALRAGGRLAAVRGSATGAAVERFASKQTTRRDGPGSIFPEDGPAPRRERAPEAIIDPVTNDVAFRTRGPRSSNILTREIQRNVTDPIGRAVKRGVGAVPLAGKNPLAPANRYQRQARKGTRDITYRFGAETEKTTMLGTEPFQFVVRRVPKILGRKNAKTAYATAAIRAMGLNNVSSKMQSRTWGRDALVRQWEESVAKVRESGEADAKSIKVVEDNIELVRSIPDEWLDPATAPGALNTLVKETEGVLRDATEAKLAAGTITKRTARLSARRAQYQAAGVYDTYLSAQKAADDAVQLSGEIRGLAEAVAKEQAKGKGANKKRISKLNSEISGKKRALQSRKKKAKEEMKVADRAIGPEMEAGVYFPQVKTLPKQKSMRQSTAPGSTAQMRLRKEPQNTGSVMREGSPSFAPDVVLAAARSANDAVFRRESLLAIFGRYSVKDAEGMPITGVEAVRVAKQNPDKYVAVNKADMEKMIQGQKGEFEPGSELANMEKAALEAIETMDDTPFLIPKSVRDEWQGILGLKGQFGATIDWAYSQWKGGVLALSPRWYIQNIFGNSLMFTLGAGLDIQAIRMAFNPRYKKSVDGDLAAYGVSSDLGELAIRMGTSPTRNPWKRVVAAGYRINNRFESVFRRAIFFHVAKKKLREENIIRQGTTNSADLASAWATVAKGARNQEDWALKIADQVRIESTRFLGEYLRYNAFERAVLRRAYPFYAWMRTVMRLAFALPVKHPKRAGLLAISSEIAYRMYNDDESALLDPYSGLVDGDKFIQTNILMPQETLTPIVAGIGRLLGTAKEGEVRRLPTEFAQEATKQAGPLVGIAGQLITGENLLGIPSMFAPDERYARDFTGRTYAIDAVTGQPRDETRATPIDAYLESFFPLAGSAKRIVMRPQSDERIASDVGLYDALMYRLGRRNREDVFIPRGSRGYEQPLERNALTEFSSLLGATPVYGYNPTAASIRRITNDARVAEAFQNTYKNRVANRAFLNVR